MNKKTQRDQQDPFFSGATQIFVSATQTLNVHGAGRFPDSVLLYLYHEVCEHVAHLHQHFGAFWQRIDPDRIDLSEFHTSLYDVVFHEFGVPIGKVSSETHRKREKLLVVRLSAEITLAMNHFLRHLLRNLKANPALIMD